MGDGRPERPLRGALGIDVDPLVVAGRLGEQLDRALLDRHPLARLELEVGRALQLGERELGGHALTATCARRALRSSLPTGVSGSDETTCTSRGYL